MDRRICRKSLAGTLKDYLRAIEENAATLPVAEYSHAIDYNISFIGGQISAVKEFARNIGLIDYAENYDMSTEKLITKIEEECKNNATHKD